MSFGKRLKHALKYKATTQKELAELLKTTPQSISQYVVGKRNPSKKMVKNIADALDFGYDFTRSGEPFFYVSLDRSLNPDEYKEIFNFNQEQHRDALNDVIEDMNDIDFFGEPTDVINYKLSPNTPLVSEKQMMVATINDSLDGLNQAGLEKLYNYSCDLLEIPKYRADTAPDQGAPAPDEAPSSNQEESNKN